MTENRALLTKKARFLLGGGSTLGHVGVWGILPVTLWARSLVSLEAMVGVLYLTIIMARLVGLYAADAENQKP